MGDINKVEEGGKQYALDLGFGHNSMDTRTWHNRLSNAFQNGAKSEVAKEFWKEEMIVDTETVMNDCCDAVGYFDVVGSVFQWMENNDYKIIKS